MEVILNNNTYKVDIVRKFTNRNTYIRVKKNLIIYVTTNTFVSDKKIKELIMESEDSIIKMIGKTEKKQEKKVGFYYLGKKYDIVYTNNFKVSFGENKIFVNKDFNMDEWYKKEALDIFEKRLEYWYHRFSYKIPHPSLTIRKMSSRWGVCNTRLKKVTLNLELIKKEIECLDYVIVHELSHFICANHSKDFWNVVEKNYPDYLTIRKKMKEE